MNYRMKTVTEKTGLTEKAVRYYISKGLLTPNEEIINGRKNYYFNDEQLHILDEICIMRFFDFSIQDIKLVFFGDTASIHQVLAEYFEIIRKKSQIISVLNKDSINIDEIGSKEQLLSILHERKAALIKETCYQPDFKRLDECIDDIPNLEENKKSMNKAYIFVFVIALIIGMVISTVFAAYRDKSATFSYGLENSSITITDIKWTDFYNWRNISLNINGLITVTVPRNTGISFNDMKNPDCMKEICREHLVHSDGNSLLYYDRVIYEIKNGNISASGILKNRNNPIIAATCGYRVGFTMEEEIECFLGYIPPLSESYNEWSKQQSPYAEMNLTPYLDAFKISRTYKDIITLNTIEIRDDIELISGEGGLLDCIIKNNTQDDWEYKVAFPAIEMWYQGVWIELQTDFAYNLTTDICPGMSNKKIVIPKQVTDQYPYLFQGIYRLVIYGVKGDCVISENFEIAGGEKVYE